MKRRKIPPEVLGVLIDVGKSYAVCNLIRDRQECGAPLEPTLQGARCNECGVTHNDCDLSEKGWIHQKKIYEAITGKKGEVIPEVLNTEAFSEVWDEWVQHRKKIRKPLDESNIKRQLKKLAGYGHDGAIASINESLDNQYQGLSPPKSQGGSGSRAVDAAQEYLKGEGL